MIHLAVFVIALAAVTSERVPCGSGSMACSQRTQTSTWGDTEYCCGDEYGMHLSTSIVNGTQKTVCMCNRIYTETECLEGQLQCRGATSIMAVGGTVRCCRTGQSMTSFHNSVVNGVMVDSCKCRAGNGRNSGNTFMSSGFMAHNSQAAHRMAPVLQTFHSNFQNGMSSMFNGVQQMMHQMNSHMNMMFQPMGMGLFPSLQVPRRDQRTPVSQMMAMVPSIANPGFWWSQLGQPNGIRGILDRPAFQPRRGVARAPASPGAPAPPGAAAPPGFNQPIGVGRVDTPAPGNTVPMASSPQAIV